MKRTYNPLSITELGRNAARALMSYPASSLPPEEAISGAGVYTIHYTGDFSAYADLRDEPIYVGKANPPGGRQGGKSTASQKPALHQRLAKHAHSIRAVENLELPDFCCRWLLLDSVWIGLTERILISRYQPLWNVLVDGFGINAPGRGRRRQARSRWDTIHPGRPEMADLPARPESAASILEAIAAHRTASR